MRTPHLFAEETDENAERESGRNRDGARGGGGFGSSGRRRAVREEVGGALPPRGVQEEGDAGRPRLLRGDGTDGRRGRDGTDGGDGTDRRSGGHGRDRAGDEDRLPRCGEHAVDDAPRQRQAPSDGVL